MLPAGLRLRSNTSLRSGPSGRSVPWGQISGMNLLVLSKAWGENVN